MLQLSFTPGLVFNWNDTLYKIRRIVDGDDVEVTNLSHNNTVEFLLLSELLTAWFNNELTFREDQGVSQAVIKADFDSISEEEKNEMNVRYKVLLPVIGQKIPSSQYIQYIQSLTEYEKKFIGSVQSLYRWKK